MQFGAGPHATFLQVKGNKYFVAMTEAGTNPFAIIQMQLRTDSVAMMADADRSRDFSYDLQILLLHTVKQRQTGDRTFSI